MRSLLGVQRVPFNVKPVARRLLVSEQTLTEIEKFWKDEDKQLEIVLGEWKKKTDDHDLSEIPESLKREGTVYVILFTSKHLLRSLASNPFFKLESYGEVAAIVYSPSCKELDDRMNHSFFLHETCLWSGSVRRVFFLGMIDSV